MNYKQSKAYLIETITSQCPHCGADFKLEDPNWRYKPYDDTGLSYWEVRCAKVKCKKPFKLKFN